MVRRRLQSLLNNTLAIILGHTELAIDETERKGFPPARLQDIREAVVHAAALCRGMLAYAGRASPIRTAVDLAELVAHLQQQVKRPMHLQLVIQTIHIHLKSGMQILVNQK